MANRTCPTCGDTFEAARGRRFCSELCWPSRRPRFASDPGEVVSAAPGTYAEVIDLLWRAARNGSVAAMQMLRREVQEDQKKNSREPSVIDDLATRRRKENADG